MIDTNIFWSAAAISIVVASWLLYRFLVPKSWREWTSVGIVQAFVIAFYAEMYGFPLTIYLLTRIFALDVSGTFWDGNLWVHIFGTPAAMFVSMMIGYAIAVSEIILLSAGWLEVYRARKLQRLATRGPYTFVRHPQYTGIFLVIFGEGVVHWPTIFSLLAFPIIVVVYVLLARKEERQMIKQFGDQYREYQRRIPMFFPPGGRWRDLVART